VRPILAVPGAGHFVRYWSLLPSAQGAMRGRSKIPVSSFPIKPDHQESDQDPDRIELNILPLRVEAINQALNDLDGACKTKNVQRSRGLLGSILAQQQGNDSRESKQCYMQNRVPTSSMRGRPQPQRLEGHRYNEHDPDRARIAQVAAGHDFTRSPLTASEASLIRE